MKKIILSLILSTIFLFLVNAQTYNALSVHGGASWVSGNIGIEYQISKFALSTGWATGKLPSGTRIHSFSGSFTYYNKNWNESSIYGTVGYATQGFTGRDFYFPYYDKTVSSIIVLGGYRAVINNVNIKAGFGINLNKYESRVELEFLIGYTLFHNKSPK